MIKNLTTYIVRRYKNNLVGVIAHQDNIKGASYGSIKR